MLLVTSELEQGFRIRSLSLNGPWRPSESHGKVRECAVLGGPSLSRALTLPTPGVAAAAEVAHEL